MAFLDKLKVGLSKTKTALFGQIDEVLKAFVRVDEDLLDELEELLIMSDVGVNATEEIIERLRDEIKSGYLRQAAFMASITSRAKGVASGSVWLFPVMYFTHS